MKGYYINLKSRKDRMLHFENLKKKFKFLKDIERSEGCTFINNEYINKFVKGSAGCAQAHLNCLKKLKKLEGEYFAIFEDDFLILDDNVFNEFINEFEKIKDSNKWDVILLMPRGYTDKKYYLNKFHRMKISRSALGYIFKKHMIELFIEVFSYSVENLKKHFKIPYSKKHRIIVGEYALDRAWSKLFNNYNFIYYYKIFGHQLKSYSDIENKEVNYVYIMEGKSTYDINVINNLLK